jgi:hypothetical protein
MDNLSAAKCLYSQPKTKIGIHMHNMNCKIQKHSHFFLAIQYVQNIAIPKYEKNNLPHIRVPCEKKSGNPVAHKSRIRTGI